MSTPTPEAAGVLSRTEPGPDTSGTRDGGTSTDDVGIEPKPVTARRRRIEAGLFVAIWVAAGYLLGLSSNAYLLLGIPLTIAFQMLVRRRPLRDLWLPAMATVVWNTRSVLVAASLAAAPIVFAVSAARAQDWSGAGWYVAAAAGAVCAATALNAGTLRGALRSALLPLSIGATGMATVYGVVHVLQGAPLSASAALLALVKYTALYFPAAFLLEEVSFRGAIDSHVHHDRDAHRWGTAIYVSALWGLWHLPVSHAFPLPLQAAELVAVHVLLGVPLSIAWRRTRNLAGPALAHGFNDAVRNAFMVGL
jgi:membrane protease YdiL (CAAX protease family)